MLIKTCLLSQRFYESMTHGYGTEPRMLEDNVKIHTCPAARIVGAAMGFRYINHPPYLPDLNPIKNCWAWIKRQLAETPKKPTNKDDLFEVISQLWDSMPQRIIDNTVDSMIRRLEMVQMRRGWPSKY